MAVDVSQCTFHQDIDLAPEAKYLLYCSFAPAARRSYNSAKGSYESFCRNYNYIHLPTSLKPITLCLADVMTTAKPISAKSYLTTLRSFHLECGFSTAVLLYISYFFKPASLSLVFLVIVFGNVQRCRPQRTVSPRKTPLYQQDHELLQFNSQLLDFTPFYS
jgi:hypothetical protein